MQLRQQRSLHFGRRKLSPHFDGAPLICFILVVCFVHLFFLSWIVSHKFRTNDSKAKRHWTFNGLHCTDLYVEWKMLKSSNRLVAQSKTIPHNSKIESIFKVFVTNKYRARKKNGQKQRIQFALCHSAFILDYINGHKNRRNQQHAWQCVRCSIAKQRTSQMAESRQSKMPKNGI